MFLLAEYEKLKLHLIPDFQPEGHSWGFVIKDEEEKVVAKTAGLKGALRAAEAGVTNLAIIMGIKDCIGLNLLVCKVLIEGGFLPISALRAVLSQEGLIAFEHAFNTVINKKGEKDA